MDELLAAASAAAAEAPRATAHEIRILLPLAWRAAIPGCV